MTSIIQKTRIPTERRKTVPVQVGKVILGGGSPISVQSMTCTETGNVEATVSQILSLEEAGCEIVRVAVPTAQAARALKKIKARIHIPLVADIHFDYRLALLALASGADKIRINPGNIGSRARVLEVLRAAKDRGAPVRIGINSGSLEEGILKKHDGITAAGMAESAQKAIRICEDAGFENLVISLKASSVPLMVEANRVFATESRYPLHLGVTEAGTAGSGSIRSSVGLGILLSEGIGDTIRVSLTGDPVPEVRTGFEILKALGLRKFGVTVISCPTCGRARIDIQSMAEAVEKALVPIKASLYVAVMGCAVNGPGEAREADLGVACGKKGGLFFKKGKVVRKVREEEIVRVLVEEAEKMAREMEEK